MRHGTRIGLISACAFFGAAHFSNAAVVQWSLSLTNDSDQPITGALSLGETFWVDVAVQDLRSDLGSAGVISAVTDLLFDPTKVMPTGNVQAGASYPLPDQRSTTPSPGVVRLSGDVPIDPSLDFVAPGPGLEILDRVELTAIASGPLTFATQIPFTGSVFVGDSTGTLEQGTASAVSLANTEIAGTSISTSVVPEPSTLVLAVAAFAALAIRQRKWAFA